MQSGCSWVEVGTHILEQMDVKLENFNVITICAINASIDACSYFYILIYVENFCNPGVGWGIYLARLG